MLWLPQHKRNKDWSSISSFVVLGLSSFHPLTCHTHYKENYIERGIPGDSKNIISSSSLWKIVSNNGPNNSFSLCASIPFLTSRSEGYFLCPKSEWASWRAFAMKCITSHMSGLWNPAFTGLSVFTSCLLELSHHSVRSPAHQGAGKWLRTEMFHLIVSAKPPADCLDQLYCSFRMFQASQPLRWWQPTVSGEIIKLLLFNPLSYVVVFYTIRYWGSLQVHILQGFISFNFENCQFLKFELTSLLCCYYL